MVYLNKRYFILLYNKIKKYLLFHVLFDQFKHKNLHCSKKINK